MFGRIIDIKRLAVHDGPGIRTTIFLKGCPLHCGWCHNPESIEPVPEIGYFPPRCSGCGDCVEVCPVQAHTFVSGKHVFNRTRCTSCGKCVSVCSSEALKYYGQEISVENAVAAVLEDRTFYQQSGGGCTVSGGEPLLQDEFCAELFRNLRKTGIHCAIDTSGAVPWQTFETILPYTDMFLYDLKHMDDNRHRKHTGVSNRMIIDNLQRLSRHQVPIEIRIPVIPGFNADDESMTAIGQQSGELDNISGVRLLPYHFAHSKYAMIGHADGMPEVALPTPEQIDHAVELLRQFGLNIK